MAVCAKMIACVILSATYFSEKSSLDEKVVLYTLVDLVIKTSATLCNINDFGRYQRMNLRDAIA